MIKDPDNLTEKEAREVEPSRQTDIMCMFALGLRDLPKKYRISINTRQYTPEENLVQRRQNDVCH